MKMAIIGCGVMGSALARHFSKRGSLMLCDRNVERSAALAQELGAVSCEIDEAIKNAEVVVLAIKPKDLEAFAKKTATLFSAKHLLISVLGSTSLERLRHFFPQPILVRALPNLPVLCGKGIVGFATDASATYQQQVNDLFQGVGLLKWLSEAHLEALSALAGCGPAFVFVLIEAMIDSGVFLGFNHQDASALVLQLLEGSVELLKTTQKHPGELKWQVASPGGTTIAGLKVLEESGVRGILMNVFQAAFLKKPLL